MKKISMLFIIILVVFSCNTDFQFPNTQELLQNVTISNLTAIDTGNGYAAVTYQMNNANKIGIDNISRINVSVEISILDINSNVHKKHELIIFDSNAVNQKIVTTYITTYENPNIGTEGIEILMVGWR